MRVGQCKLEKEGLVSLTGTRVRSPACKSGSETAVSIASELDRHASRRSSSARRFYS